MERTCFAAAIPEGAVISLPDDLIYDKRFTVDEIQNGTPRAGKITWYDSTRKEEIVIGASTRVYVHSFPKEY